MDINQTIEYCVNEAVKLANSYDKVFDFNYDTVKEIDKILDMYHEKYINPDTDNGLIKNRINTFSYIFGVYVGEILRINYANDYIWQESEYGLVLAKDNNNFINPIAKAYKQIENGKEGGDDIKSFFDVAVMIVQGKIKTS